VTYVIVPANQAQPGDIVLQHDAVDLMSLATWIDSTLRGKKPRFTHCGVFVGAGQMVTVAGKQDAGAANSIAVRYPWADYTTTHDWLVQQMGKPYDGWALLWCAISILLPKDSYPQDFNRYTCSSLVASAMYKDNPIKCPQRFTQRTVSPDDIALALGV